MWHVEGPLEKTDLDRHYEKMEKDMEAGGLPAILGAIIAIIIMALLFL